MRQSYDDKVKRWVGNQQEWQPYRDKVYEQFKILPGASDVLAAYQQTYAHRRRNVGTKRSYPELFVENILAGKINYPLRDISTLVKQVSFRLPTVLFRGLLPESQWLHSEYMKKRFNRHTNAALQAELALWSYLVAGIAIFGVEFREGVPSVVYKNPLDCTWDMEVETIDQCRWISVKSRESWDYWRHVFGKSFEAKVPYVEGVVQLEFFYSRDSMGKKGSHYVLDHAGEIIEKSDNPYTKLVDGVEESYLPYTLTPLYFLPWNVFPFGILDMMMPACLGAWRAEDYIQGMLDEGPGLRVIDKSRFDVDQTEKLENGERVTTLFTSGDGTPAGAVAMYPSFPVPADVYAYKRDQEEASIAMAGADVFASGATAPNVRFAKEAEALDARASLTRDKVAVDFITMWRETIQRFLHAAKKYDYKPVTLVRDDGTTIEFSENTEAGPVAIHLRPDAEIIIRPDTTSYTSQLQETGAATADLVDLAPFGGLYPEMTKHLVKRRLIAAGHDDVDKLLTAPLLQAENTSGDPDEGGTK